MNTNNRDWLKFWTYGALGALTPISSSALLQGTLDPSWRVVVLAIVSGAIGFFVAIKALDSDPSLGDDPATTTSKT